jgi:malonate-semialdehyde dehydrogenase (acetylating)/methylmalonate-semialdehyde dehydrogenase
MMSSLTPGLSKTSKFVVLTRALSTLPRTHSILNGKAFISAGTTTFPITDCSTGTVIGATPQSTASELEAAAAGAEAASTAWRMTPPAARARVTLKLQALIRDNTESLAAVITRENGKTLADARGDVFRGLEVVEWASGAPSLSLGDCAPGIGPSMDIVTHREPVGVCAGIFAFNFPAMLPLWAFPLANALGNTYVLKPSERAPGAAVALALLATSAGLPPDVLNVVHGGPDTVNFLCDSPRIAAVSFVGSNPGGEHVFHRASAAGKRVQSNMGAKNIAIVMPDSDAPRTCAALTGAAFGAAGQRCMALPVIVLVGAAKEHTTSLIAAARRLKIGPGSAIDSDIGPMISRESVNRARDIVSRAESMGARVLLDGRTVKPPAGCEKGFWLGPTILHLGDAHSAEKSPAYLEEIFGPVQCIIEVDTLDEAIGIVNRNEWGNGGAIFTASGATAHTFATSTRIGNVGINVPVPVPLPVVSFTGNKRSFLGQNNFYGRGGVNFFTSTRTFVSSWPPPSSSGAGVVHASPLVMPTPGRT